jgi:nickel transport protein
MNKFAQTLTKLSLIAGVITSSGLTYIGKSSALPIKEVIQKLQDVPVFAVVNAQGKPLVGQLTNKDKKQLVSYVFLTETDASKLLTTLKPKNPSVANVSHVTVLPLSTVYQTQISQPKVNAVSFLFMPNPTQVQAAKQLVTTSGSQYKWGVPLFVVLSPKNKGYLILKQKNREAIPLFFSISDAQKLLDKIKQQKPELATNLTIGIIPLEGLLGKLKDSNDPLLGKFVLIPLSEAIAEAKALQPSIKK